MILFIQCIVLCALFTIVLLPMQFKNPLSLITSYPPEIIKRVESLPQYKDVLAPTKQKGYLRKVLVTLISILLLGGLAYFSGKTSFSSAFIHVFILFLSVNLYDLIIMDFIVFPRWKRLVIPGTEDMHKEYRNKMHHVKGAFKGLIIGTLVSILAACIVQLIYFLVNF